MQARNLCMDKVNHQCRGLGVFVFVVPFADIALEDSGTSEDDETNVHKLGGEFCGSCGVYHVCIVTDDGEEVCNLK